MKSRRVIRDCLRMKMQTCWSVDGLSSFWRADAVRAQQCVLNRDRNRNEGYEAAWVSQRRMQTDGVRYVMRYVTEVANDNTGCDGEKWHRESRSTTCSDNGRARHVTR